MITMEQWDRDVRPYLQDISYFSKRVAQSVEMLSLRPDFLTVAECGMAETRRALQEALAKIDKAQAEYASKPAEAA